MVNYPDLTENGRLPGATDSQKNWNVLFGALTYRGRIYIPEPLRSNVTSHCHDNPKSSNCCAGTNADLVLRGV